MLVRFNLNLGQWVTLTGGQFFAAFRLVVHTQEGEGVDRGLAFVQGEFVFTSFLCLLCGSCFLALFLVLAFTLMCVWVGWTLDGYLALDVNLLAFVLGGFL